MNILRLVTTPVAASQPIRAAWIEIQGKYGGGFSRLCRSPFGLRGLKCKLLRFRRPRLLSQPIRAAWIEIVTQPTPLSAHTLSQPIRAAWIEITATSFNASKQLSQPIRAAWIEIQNKLYNPIVLNVAAHSGCVD